MNDAFDHEFAELLPPDIRPDECAEFLLDNRIYCLVHVSLMVEVDIQPSVPRLVQWCIRPSGRTLYARASHRILILIPFVTRQHIDGVCITLHHLRRYLYIVFPRRCDVKIEDGISCAINQQCRLHLLYR